MTEAVSLDRPRRRRVHALLAVICSLGVVLSPGCATFTGLVTGAFTGAIDAPAQVYRNHRSVIDHNPSYWFYNVILFFPLGMAVGPVAGMIKGAALDIQCLILDQVTYDKAFNSYRAPSIWRPYTIHW